MGICKIFLRVYKNFPLYLLVLSSYVPFDILGIRLTNSTVLKEIGMKVIQEIMDKNRISLQTSSAITGSIEQSTVKFVNQNR